jgi:hypothetical protein
MTAFLYLALLAVQQPSLANPVRVEGPSKICIGQASFEAEAGETVTLDYAGTYWAGISVRGPEGSFTIRTSDMFAAPRGTIGFRVRRTNQYHAVRFPRWNGIDAYLLYGRLPSDPDRARPIVRVEGRTTSDSVNRWVLDRIKTEESDPASCDHRVDFRRRLGARG